jgi:hypothetical protein
MAWLGCLRVMMQTPLLCIPYVVVQKSPLGQVGRKGPTIQPKRNTHNAPTIYSLSIESTRCNVVWQRGKHSARFPARRNRRPIDPVCCCLMNEQLREQVIVKRFWTPRSVSHPPFDRFTHVYISCLPTRLFHYQAEFPPSFQLRLGQLR